MTSGKVPFQAPGPIRMGISSCLLGQEVRYNGGHVRDDLLLSTLGQHVQWVPVCPEVEVGMGVPRENIRLVGESENPRLIAPKSGTDYTEIMKKWSSGRLAELKDTDLHGYILKKDSPSCGLFRTRVYKGDGSASRNGRGLFAGELVKRFPMLPIEEEGRLRDSKLRENFIGKVFAYQRFRGLISDNPSASDLVEFHASHKLSIMAHDPQSQKQLGQLVAKAGRADMQDLIFQYGRLFMETLSEISTSRKHSNVLQHIMGYLKKYLDSHDKREMVEVIDQYRLELIPLVVPITLLRHHLNRHPVPEWIKQQTYLNPYPQELMLRNHV
jgi:uncharacterized protein YbgA (DUF1722 family)/uncharacterized protein YbbK (DUF523 family)